MLASTELNALGWISMLLSCGSVTGVTVWCFVRVLTTPEPEADADGDADAQTDPKAPGRAA